MLTHLASNLDSNLASNDATFGLDRQRLAAAGESGGGWGIDDSTKYISWHQIYQFFTMRRRRYACMSANALMIDEHYNQNDQWSLTIFKSRYVCMSALLHLAKRGQTGLVSFSTTNRNIKMKFVSATSYETKCVLSLRGCIITLTMN